MSTISEVLGQTHTFEADGKTYNVKLVDQGVKADFEDRLYGRAITAAGKLRDVMTPSQYEKHLKQLNDDYIAGEYAFESKRGIETVQTIKGMLTLCGLLFDCDESELLGLVTRHQTEVQNLILMIFKESFPDAAKRMDEVAAKEGNQVVAVAKKHKGQRR